MRLINANGQFRSSYRIIALGVGLIAVITITVFASEGRFSSLFGTQPAAIPDLVGQQQETARMNLMNAGWGAPSLKAEAVADPTKIGVVTRTDPPAGQLADKNKSIIIFIGKPPSST
ncbi:PASTA domain-containing protein [Pseudonocardia spinosispora]|uniref:PASTA domain-containing protein n=1 Tax=Pseudonocardia spinosispora TaxID=103441 RepID=UPI00048E2415|nr:PASTA domain-containing protein [Pseudonocardia spinosispora]